MVLLVHCNLDIQVQGWMNEWPRISNLIFQEERNPVCNKLMVRYQLSDLQTNSAPDLAGFHFYFLALAHPIAGIDSGVPQFNWMKMEMRDTPQLCSLVFR